MTDRDITRLQVKMDNDLPITVWEQWFINEYEHLFDIIDKQETEEI